MAEQEPAWRGHLTDHEQKLVDELDEEIAEHLDNANMARGRLQAIRARASQRAVRQRAE